MKERDIGLHLIPTMVKITKDNIYCARTEDGKQFESVVVRLPYNRHRYVYLAFSPSDGALRTLWFKDKKNASTRERADYEANKQAVPDIGLEDDIRGHSGDRSDTSWKEESDMV